MFEEILTMSIDEIRKGYTYNKEKKAYKCYVCDKTFEADEVFKVDSRYVKADKAARIHVKESHGGMLDVLFSGEKRETGLTDNQKKLLTQMSTGKSDKEIAQALGVSASTVRHQKFVFRQKVKQAKMLIAVYELAKEGVTNVKAEDKPVAIHKNAKLVDERYNVTEAERDKILNSIFDSLEPLRLKVFSAKEKKKLVAITKIAESFEADKIYTEKEINNIIEPIYHDYVTIRRYLIEYGFLDRKKDCSEYWVK